MHSRGGTAVGVKTRDTPGGTRMYASRPAHTHTLPRPPTRAPSCPPAAPPTNPARVHMRDVAAHSGHASWGAASRVARRRLTIGGGTARAASPLAARLLLTTSVTPRLWRRREECCATVHDFWTQHGKPRRHPKGPHCFKFYSVPHARDADRRVLRAATGGQAPGEARGPAAADLALHLVLPAPAPHGHRYCEPRLFDNGGR